TIAGHRHFAHIFGARLVCDQFDATHPMRRSWRRFHKLRIVAILEIVTHDSMSSRMIRRPPGAMGYFVPSNKLVINSYDQARLGSTCCHEHGAAANELPFSEFDTRIAMQ